VTAVLFPGQGSQTKDMRADVERLRPDLLELARSELGTDPFERIEEGTHFAQPAIYCASLAGWSLIDPDEVSCMAGHSLGEFSALVAAGVLTERDGLRLVALRGRLMHEAEEGGGMMAVGTPVEVAAELAGRFGLTVANDNAPEQVVLSGDGDAVDAAVEQAKAEGLRATRLRVSGAFHSPAMGAAAAELGAALDEVELGEPSVPVYCCVNVEPYGDVRRLLVEGLTSPVRWRETVLAMQSAGETRFLEVGPGKVLAGLVRRIIDGADATSLKEAARA
jgi:malonyl CoA-acyl carrier protein transacylase